MNILRYLTSPHDIARLILNKLCQKCALAHSFPVTSTCLVSPITETVLYFVEVHVTWYLDPGVLGRTIQTCSSCTSLPGVWQCLDVKTPLDIMATNKQSTSMTHAAGESKLCSVLRSSIHPWQSYVWVCIMPELLTHLVQELNIGTVRTFQTLFHDRSQMTKRSYFLSSTAGYYCHHSLQQYLQ